MNKIGRGTFDFLSSNTLVLVIGLVALFNFGCLPSQQAIIPPEGEDVPQFSFPPYAGEKKTIAVIGIRNESQFDSKEFRELRVGYGMVDMLKMTLWESGGFRLVERESHVLKKVIEEQWLGQTGMIDDSEVVRLGKMIGVKYFLYGKVSEFGIRKYGIYAGLAGTRSITTRIALDAFIVDTETAEIVCAAHGVGSVSTKTSGVMMIWEKGVEKFDETTIGKATRKACYQLASKLLACH